MIIRAAWWLKATASLNPAFPHAQHVIQKGEWETGYQLANHHPIIKKFLKRYKDSVNIHFVEDSGELKPGIKYELSGGHCPFHQVFWIDDNGDKCFFGGDELPEPEQLIRKFIAKYDYDGRKAMQLREEYGKKAAEEELYLFILSCQIKPCG